MDNLLTMSKRELTRLEAMHRLKDIRLAHKGSPRYLILRDDTRLPNIGLAPFWFVLRGWFQKSSGYEPAFHPVPNVLSTNKERAGSFSGYWKRFVCGGRLVFTRSEEGR